MEQLAWRRWLEHYSGVIWDQAGKAWFLFLQETPRCWQGCILYLRAKVVNHNGTVASLPSVLCDALKKRDLRTRAILVTYICLEKLTKLTMEDDGCSPSTWEVEIGGSGVQGHPQLYNEVKAKPAV